jgi:hypothetical protein
MARHRSGKGSGLPLALVRLIHAAKHVGEEDEHGDIRGVAEALREFGALARWVLPIHGVFVPNNNDVCIVIERVAREHLDLAERRAQFRQALKGVELFAQRDPIETAHNDLQAASDEAYFYAGLAFGVTLAER